MEQDKDKVKRVLEDVEILPIDYLQSNNIECEYIREFKMFHPVIGWVQVESYYLPKFDLFKWQMVK